MKAPKHVLNEDLWDGATGMTPGEKMRNYIHLCHEKAKDPFKEATGTSSVATTPIVGQGALVRRTPTQKKKKKKKTPLQEVLTLCKDLQKVIDDNPKYQSTHGQAAKQSLRCTL